MTLVPELFVRRLNKPKGLPINVRDVSVTGDGQTDDYAALNESVRSAGATGTLYFPAGTYVVGTNLTIPACCIFAFGAKLKPSSGVTVTLSGPVEAAPGESVIATGTAGTVSITGAIESSGGVLDVRAFGAVGDGVTDDTAAIQRCLNLGLPTLLEDGATYRVTSNIAVSANLKLSGFATILFDFVGIGLTLTGSTVDIRNVTFDGDDQCHRVVFGTGQSSVILDNCTFLNVYGTGTGGTGFTCGVHFRGPDSVRITRCTFRKIRALANGTEGDDAGAVRAIYLRDAVDSAVISECVFDDINNQDISGTINNEDADAIQGQSLTSNETQRITVINCTFNNCGKRAAKFQAGPESVSRFANNVVISGWTTPSVSVQTAINSKAMFSVVDVLGGSLFYTDNLAYGGVIAYMVAANDSVADIPNIHLANNIHTPLAAEFGFTNNYPARMVVNTTNPRATRWRADVTEINNVYRNLWSSSNISVRHFVSNGNFDDSKQGVYRINSAVTFAANGNVVLGSATVTNEYGFWFRDSLLGVLVSATFSGNVIGGYYDGIYFGGGLNGATYKVAIVGNTFSSQVRNDVSEFTTTADRANYTYVGNNTTKATNTHYALRGVTSSTVGAAGGASALPATPSAYETVVVNATQYKRPLYLP